MPLGLLNTGLIGSLKSVFTAQMLISAWATRGISGVLLPTSNYYSTSGGIGTLVPADGQGTSYTAQNSSSTPSFINNASGPNGASYLSASPNQALRGAVSEVVAAYIVIVKSNETNFNTFWGPLELNESGTHYNNAVGYFGQSSSHMQNDGVARPRYVRKNGLLLSTAYDDLSPASSWMILTIGSGNPSLSRLLQLFCLTCQTGSYFGNGSICAIGKWTSEPTSVQMSDAERDASLYSGISVS